VAESKEAVLHAVPWYEYFPKKFDKTLLNGLRKFVESALWIKFADADALKIQAERDLKTAHDIVESTRGIKEVL